MEQKNLSLKNKEERLRTLKSLLARKILKQRLLKLVRGDIQTANNCNTGEIQMNKKQRVILTIGAIILVIVVVTAPKVCIMQGSIFEASEVSSNVAEVIEWQTTLFRCIATLGATALFYLAFGSSGKKE